MKEKLKKLYKNKTIVGFCGYKRSGKGTCAEALHPLGYVDVPFAGGLKAMLAAWLKYNGVEDVDIYTDGWFKDHRSRYFNDKEFRYAMQTLGTEWGRAFMGKEFWIKGWERQMAKHDLIAVSDVRFPDEVDAIREKGGIVIKVRRPSFLNLDQHESESNMESLVCDYEIVNIKIDETQQQVVDIVNKHFEKRVKKKNGK